MISLGAIVLNANIVVMDDPLGHWYPFFAGRVGYPDAGSVVEVGAADGVYVSTMGVWQGTSTTMSLMTVTVAADSGVMLVGEALNVLVTMISLCREVGQ